MTKFKREDFSYHGGYLTYEGDHGAATKYWPNEEKVHESKRGMPRRDMFIARFKYSARDKARFMTFLINNFSVEEYDAAYNTSDPTNPWGNTFAPAVILEAKGYVSTTSRKGMKEKGYTSFSKADYRDYMDNHVFDKPAPEYWAEEDKKHAAILAACAAA
jgi:hypothetical protein